MSAPKISAEKFAREYAERSGVTVEWLAEQGRRARPCLHCDSTTCQGWQMIADELWLNDCELYGDDPVTGLPK